MPKVCQQNGCSKTAHFGFLGQEPMVCKQHIKEDMLMYPNVYCCFNLCKEFAQFGLKLEQPIFCNTHKTDESQYLLFKQCEECKLLFNPKLQQQDQQVQQQIIYNKKCKNCYDVKLEKVCNFITSEMSEYVLDQSEQLQNCQKKPNFVFKASNDDHLVVLFVEYSQKKQQKIESDFENMQYIFEILRKKITFIFFNIDQYKQYQKQKAHNPDVQTRLQTLQDILYSSMQQEITNSNYVSKYIYFDGFNI